MAKIPFKAQTEIDQEKYQTQSQEMLNKVRKNAGELIEERFPLFDQVNLITVIKTKVKDRLTGELVNQVEMEAIIKKMIAASNQLEGEIKDTTTLKELEEIDTSKENLTSLAKY